MAVSTFGIDIDVLRQYMPGLPTVPDSTTYPSATELTAIITRKSQIWCARAENQAGVDIVAAALDSDAQIYGIMQECIALSVCIQLAYGRERRNPDQIAQWKEDRDAAWERMAMEPGSNGDGQDKSANAAYLVDSHVNRAAQVLEATRYQPLGTRLAQRGVL